MYQFTPSETATYYGVRAPGIRQTRTRQWRGACIIHGGDGPSFAVNSDTGEWYCHSQCRRGGDIILLEQALTGADFPAARDEVFRLIGRVPVVVDPQRTLHTTGRRRSHKQHPPRRSTVAVPGTETTNASVSTGPTTAWRDVDYYDYTDEAGRLLFQIVRQERLKQGKRVKTFRVRRPVRGGRWRWEYGDVRRVPYRLPELLSAPIVLLPEGERDVETLREWGFVATTNPHGADGWRDEFDQFFADLDVVIMPDGDPPGWYRAFVIARRITPIAKRVRILELEGAKDITEWFAQGHSECELIAILEDCDAV